MKALMFFAPLFRPHLSRFTLALALSLVTIAAGVALLGVSGWFLTATALTAIGVSFNLFAPSAAVRGFSLIRIVSRYFEKLTGHNATLALLSDIRRWLFERLFPRAPLPTRALRHGDLVSLLTGDVDALDTLFLLAIGPLLAALIIGGIVTGILFLLLPAAGSIYLAALIASALVIPAILVVSSRAIGEQLTAALAELRIRVLDAVAGHDDIILFGQQDNVRRGFETATATLSSLRKRQMRATSIAAALVQVTTGAALLAIVVIGLMAMEQDALDGPILAGIVFGVMGSFEATAMIVRSVGKFGQAAASAARLQAIATLPPAIIAPRKPIALPKGQSIHFNGVSFAYENGAQVLSSLDLAVKEGEHIAISGPSGSGKSTLLHLLLRLDDVRAGSILVADTDIRDVAPDALHSTIALLSQDSPVFLDTVRNNLLIARPDATDAELWSALRDARLEGVVRALPLGLDSMVGETGTTLSAGQARRLCLARTILSPAPIVALDEPTAGLDRETETAFLLDLPHVLAGRTILLVTHADIPAGSTLRQLKLINGQISDTPPR